MGSLLSKSSESGGPKSPTKKLSTGGQEEMSKEMEAVKAPTEAMTAPSEAATAPSEGDELTQKVEPTVESAQVIPAQEKPVELEKAAEKDEGPAAQGKEEPVNISDVSLLTEASQVPIPPSSYVDQCGTPAGLKPREDVDVNRGKIVPSPLSFEEKTEEEVTESNSNEPDKKPKQQSNDDLINDDLSRRGDDENMKVNPSSEVLSQAPTDQPDKLDNDFLTKGDDEVSSDKIVDSHNEVTNNDADMKSDEPDVVNSLDEGGKKTNHMMTAECEILDDSNVTKEVSVHQEMVLPVEELAEQFSNVVISMATRELHAEHEGVKKPDEKMEEETGAETVVDTEKADNQEEDVLNEATGKLTTGENGDFSTKTELADLETDVNVNPDSSEMKLELQG